MCGEIILFAQADHILAKAHQVQFLEKLKAVSDNELHIAMMETYHRNTNGFSHDCALERR